MRTENSTLCYIIKDGQWLMLNRNKKKNDINAGKWIGVGGHFEAGETPGECLMREVFEETGFELTSYELRGIVTFISGDDLTEYMFLYTADGFIRSEENSDDEESPGSPDDIEGPFDDDLPVCNEGTLAWIPEEEIMDLELWEGDRIFLEMLMKEEPFFSLKLVYDDDGNLLCSVLE